jgi:hypothetical protein
MGTVAVTITVIEEKRVKKLGTISSGLKWSWAKEKKNIVRGLGGCWGGGRGGGG